MDENMANVTGDEVSSMKKEDHSLMSEDEVEEVSIDLLTRMKEAESFLIPKETKEQGNKEMGKNEGYRIVCEENVVDDYNQEIVPTDKVTKAFEADLYTNDATKDPESNTKMIESQDVSIVERNLVAVKALQCEDSNVNYAETSRYDKDEIISEIPVISTFFSKLDINQSIFFCIS